MEVLSKINNIAKLYRLLPVQDTGKIIQDTALSFGFVLVVSGVVRFRNIFHFESVDDFTFCVVC